MTWMLYGAYGTSAGLAAICTTAKMVAFAVTVVAFALAFAVGR